MGCRRRTITFQCFFVGVSGVDDGLYHWPSGLGAILGRHAGLAGVQAHLLLIGFFQIVFIYNLLAGGLLVMRQSSLQDPGLETKAIGLRWVFLFYPHYWSSSLQLAHRAFGGPASSRAFLARRQAMRVC